MSALSGFVSIFSLSWDSLQNTQTGGGVAIILVA